MASGCCVSACVHVCVCKSMSNKWHGGAVVTPSLPMVLYCPGDHELSPSKEIDCFALMRTQSDTPTSAHLAAH